MESGRFAEFFKNAPFDKRSVLRGFRGFSPPVSHDPPDHMAKGGFLGLSGSGRNWYEGGIDEWDSMDVYPKS